MQVRHVACALPAPPSRALNHTLAHLLDPPDPHLTPFHCPGVRAEFPITQDSITTQQLVYLRLARLQDSAQLAKASCWGE